MALPPKNYFSLDEIEARWAIPRRDIAYYAENGLLEVSARVRGVTLEEGIEFDDEGRLQYYPTGYRLHHGLLPLLDCDAAEVFRTGQAKVYWFSSPPETFVRVAHDEIAVSLDDLVIARAERDRFEREHEMVPEGTVPVPAATAGPNVDLGIRLDYAMLVVRGERFTFGPTQARVVRQLHEAWREGRPWVHGKAALGVAKAKSRRLVDLFKSQPRWRELIRSDGAGLYRLNLPDRRDPT